MKIQNENLNCLAKDIVIEAQDVLDAFMRVGKEVISAEYRDGEFHIETVHGPISFQLFGNASGKEDA